MHKRMGGITGGHVCRQFGDIYPEETNFQKSEPLAVEIDIQEIKLYVWPLFSIVLIK